MKNVLLGILVLSVFAVTSCTSTPENGRDVIEQMQAKWNGKVPQHMTFEQETTYYRMGFVEEEQIWYMAISSPGKMHIRVNTYESGNGMLFRNDSAYYYTKSELTFSEVKYHYLLGLTFDVFQQDPAITVAQLEKDEFDLTKMYESIWNERPVYVIGTTDSLDIESNQFIVDKEDLVALRSIRNRDGVMYTVDFVKYEEVGGYQVLTELVFARDGEKAMSEKYLNIQFPESMDSKIYHPTEFIKTKWE